MYLRLIVVTLFLLPLSMVAQTHTTGPQFTFIDNDRGHDLGGIVKNSVAYYEVQFKNSGDEPLIITDLHLSPCDTTGPPRSLKMKWPKQPVKPGKKGIITVSFTAFDETGSFKNEILVSSNATPRDYSLLWVVGAIVPFKSDYSGPAPETSGWFELLLPVILNVAK